MTAQLCTPESRTLRSNSPVTGALLGQVPCDDPASVANALEHARTAQQAWAALGVERRNAILGRLPGVLIDRADEIAAAVSAENGKPPVEAASLILPICATVDLAIGMAHRLRKGTKVSTTFFVGDQARIHYDPLGVVGFILPWNFPFELGVKHMIPALASGNAVVQKPSECNPMIGQLILSIFRDAGVPQGVVQMVNGYADVGEALVDGADAICFVGSPGTGRRIMERASRTLTPVFLELGGNDAALVLDDADLDLTARGLVHGTCYNAGQVCNGIERIYAPRDMVEPLVGRLLPMLRALRQGPDNVAGAAYDMGPMAFPKQREVYEDHLQDALKKGAVLHHGGEVQQGPHGLYWPATLLTGVNHEMEIMKEETFGPFLPIMAYDDEAQALALVNDSAYGLGGSVWTRDLARGRAVARRFRSGSCMVNNAIVSGGCVTLPFGGQGESGLGRLQGEQSYYNYTAPRSIMVSRAASQRAWMPYRSGAQAQVLALARMFYGRGLGERIRGLVGLLRNG